MPDRFEVPAPRTLDPDTAPVLRWGVLGPGRIAAQFTESLLRHSRQRVVAVASRDGARAREFAATFEIPHAFEGYDELLASSGVDVVYVATPHSAHRECALAAIAAGTHVLVEKPLALDASEAVEIAAAARAAGVFAMEAMWPRFLPAADSIRQLLERGTLGEVAHLDVDLGEYFPRDASNRLFDPALGGGSPLDLGVYLTAFASTIFAGAPRTIDVRGRRAFTGVVADADVTLGYANGEAHLYTTLDARTPTTAFIKGSKATLRTDAPFYAPTELTLASNDGTAEDRRTFDPVSQASGLCYEAAAVTRAIADGSTESPLMPLAESIASLRILDEVERLVPHGSTGPAGSTGSPA